MVVAKATAAKSVFLATMESRDPVMSGTILATRPKTAEASSSVTVVVVAQQAVLAVLRRVSRDCSLLWMSVAPG